MGKITVETCDIEGLKIITPQVFGDARGYFMETYHAQAYQEAGINTVFVQDNQSASKRGVLRGLHIQMTSPQAKLVRAIAGEVYDVAVDVRKGSPTYGAWHGVVLSAENKKQFYIPEGFLHGFLVMSEYAEFTYKVSTFYQPSDEQGVLWNDEEIGIDWPFAAAGLKKEDLILSEKDQKNLSLSAFRTLQNG